MADEMTPNTAKDTPKKSGEALENQDFRKTLGQFATGVTIITTIDADGAPLGVTASSFNSVSMDPPLILWSLAKDALSLPAYRDSESFIVHVLNSEQEQLSNLFARRGADKFDEVEFMPGLGGAPLLNDCAATFQCKTRHQYEGGDHIIFVGEVMVCDSSDKDPLLFHAGRYAAALPKIGIDPAEPGAVDLQQGKFTSDFFIYLLSRAHFQFSRSLLGLGGQFDIPRAGHYVISVLCQQDGLDRDGILERISVTGHRPGEDVFQQLQELGFVSYEAEGGIYRITDKGRDFQISLLAHSLELEEQVLSDFSPEEIGLFKDMLKRLISKTDAGLPNLWS